MLPQSLPRPARTAATPRAGGGFTVRDLPPAERPRERLVQCGAGALSEQELLACVLGRGVAGESVLVGARRLLTTFGGIRGIADASVEQLAQVYGIGPAKAIQLKAAIELARRLHVPTAGRRLLVDCLEVAADLVRPHLVDKHEEHFIAVLLTNRHQCIRVVPIAVGSLSATLVHPRELFKPAIQASAAAIIIAHNHPSGDPQPSADDETLTQRLIEAGRLIGIEVLDHLIVGGQAVVSLRAAGLMAATHASLRPPHDSRRQPQRSSRRPHGS